MYVLDSSHFLFSDTFSWGFFDNATGAGSAAYGTADNSGPAGNTFSIVLGIAPVYNIIPLGKYSSRIREADSYCSDTSKAVQVTEGKCTNTDVGPLATVPSTTITGQIIKNDSEQPQNDSIPELTPGVTYAILFDGLTPEESSTKVPFALSVANENGEYVVA